MSKCNRLYFSTARFYFQLAKVGDPGKQLRITAESGPSFGPGQTLKYLNPAPIPKYVKVVSPDNHYILRTQGPRLA